MDPFEEFEFKPLAEGLGFHKKAEKLEQDIKVANLVEEKIGRTVPEAPPAEMLRSQAASMQRTSVLDRDEDTDLTSPPRQASKSISDLIAALPPSLDFLDESGKTESASEESDSSVSYPFLTKKKRISTEPKAVTSAGIPAPSSAAKTDIATAARLFDEPIGESGGHPQIFQPLGREEYTAPSEKTSLKTSVPTPGSPANLSASSMGSSSMANPAAARSSTGLPPSPTYRPTPGTPAVGTPQNRKLEESYARAFPHADKAKSKEEPKQPITVTEIELQKVSASFAPAIIDAMAVLGVSTIFLVIIIVITQIDLVRMLTHATTNVSAHVHLGLLFLCVMQLYVLSARSFFGATLGEWAFDIQLGTGEEQKTGMYPVKILWRMLLVLATGIVTLPILSKIFGRDLLADLGGPQLYRRPQ